MCVCMWCRAERLLQEYAEAKLALMNTDLRSAGRRHDDDDDDHDINSHYSSRDINAVYSRGRDSQASSNVNSKPGQKYHSSNRCRENPASLRAPAHHSAWRKPVSRENSASRENRGTKSVAKQSECVRSPLGVISRQDNLLVLGHSALPPLPSERLMHRRGYLDS